ncbi:hypothetical protein ACS0TY_025416 [Phlomoides rotata]
MNLSNSECSSGCESGWTTYLDQFSDSTNLNTKNYIINYEEEKGGNLNEEDEDLSMVSDASSGPPNLRKGAPHYYGYASSAQEDMKKKKSKSKEIMKMQQNVCLDDTASSHNFYQDNAVPPDQNRYPVEHLSHDESTPKKRFGFLKSSGKGKSGSFLGRKRQ